MKEQDINEISSEFFLKKNSLKSLYNSNTTYNNIQTCLEERSKPNLPHFDSITAINSEEKEIIGENIVKANLESNENSTYESESIILSMHINSQNHDTNVKMFQVQKNEKLSSNTNFTEKSKTKIISLNTKTKRNKKNVNDSEKIKFKRENNTRKMIGRNFFNEFFFKLIEKMIFICNFYSYFVKFPKEFIFNAVKKENTDIINYSFEELIKNAESYKVKDNTKKDAPSYVEIIDKINSDENEIKMKEKGYDKYLKMNFKELFEEYLKSKEHKDKIEKLKSKKGESEKFKYLSNVFIQGYYN